MSVVIPVFNEEDNISLLFERVNRAVSETGRSYEIIFVDDGSSDDSFRLAATLASTNPQLKVVKFRRNYGQTPAMVAGINQSKGRIIITMDGDLQNDPRDIPLFLDKMDEGYDLVVGWRHNRKDKLVSRKIPSKIANWLIGKVTGVPIKDNGCSLKAYRAEVIKNVPLYSEMHRFIPAMSSIAGTRIAEIRVRHHARQFGESKYGLTRIYKVALDLALVKTLLVSVASPMKVFGLAASASLLFGIALFSVGVLGAATDGVGSWLMVLGTGALAMCLGANLLLLGFLSSLMFVTEDVDRSQLAFLALRNERASKGNGKISVFDRNTGTQYVG